MPAAEVKAFAGGVAVGGVLGFMGGWLCAERLYSSSKERQQVRNTAKIVGGVCGIAVLGIAIKTLMD